MDESKSSVSRLKKIVGVYRFRIEGYSGLSDKVGDSVESPEFTLCDFTWQLRIFPGGSLDAHADHVSYYLASKSNRVSRASYRLSVINHIMGGEDETFSSAGVRVFEAQGVQVDGWGRDKFMLNSLLKDPVLGYCVDDVVVFKVDITVCGDLEPSLNSIVENHQDTSSFSLHRCMEALITEQAQDGCFDIDVIVSPSNSSSSYPSVAGARFGSVSSLYNRGRGVELDEETKDESSIFSAGGGRGSYIDSVAPRDGSSRRREAFVFGSEPSRNTSSSSSSSSSSSKIRSKSNSRDCERLPRDSSEEPFALSSSSSTIRAHRAILAARSPVFRAMLHLEMLENCTGAVIITDFSLEIVREFLFFLYTDGFSSESAMKTHCVGLLSIAKKYLVAGLAAKCEVYLVSQISEDTVFSLLLVADRLAATHLKQEALHYVSVHSESVLQRAEALELDGELGEQVRAVVQSAARKRSCMGGLLVDRDRRFSNSCHIS